MGGAVCIALKDATNQVVISKLFWDKKVGKAKKSKYEQNKRNSVGVHESTIAWIKSNKRAEAKRTAFVFDM